MELAEWVLEPAALVQVVLAMELVVDIVLVGFGAWSLAPLRQGWIQPGQQ